MKKLNAVRQGEILIFRIPEKKANRLKEGLKLIEPVIREGEKSGHKHELEGQASLFGESENQEAKDKGMVLEVGAEGAELKHPEHETVKLPKGQYDVKIQKEYDEKKEKKAKD